MYWLLKGHADNVLYSIRKWVMNGKFLWGFHSGLYRLWERELQAGHIVFIYANLPIGAIVFLGKIVRKFEDKTEFWPIDSKYGDSWPYRIEVEPHQCLLGLKDRLQTLSEGELLKVLKSLGITRHELREKFGVEVIPGSVQRLSDEVGLRVEELFTARIEQIARVGDRVRKVIRKFNPVMLQALFILPGEDKFERYLQLLGYILRKLLLPKVMELAENAVFTRDEIVNVASEFLSTSGINLPAERCNRELKPRLTNDLRRLDIVRIDNFLSDWSTDKVARPGKTLLFLASKLRNVPTDLLLGAIAIASAALVGETPCCEVLRHLLVGDIVAVSKLAEKYESEVKVTELEKLLNAVQLELKKYREVVGHVLWKYGVSYRLITRLLGELP